MSGRRKGGIGAGAHVVLDYHERLIEARLHHVAGEAAIDIDADFAAYIHMANLRCRRAAKGMPEDAETREVEALAPHVSWSRVQPVKLVHDEDHIL